MNKQEITTNQNNDQAYQEYYERKRIAMVMEKNNNSKIIAIPSLNKNAKDEWLYCCALEGRVYQKHEILEAGANRRIRFINLPA